MECAHANTIARTGITDDKWHELVSEYVFVHFITCNGEKWKKILYDVCSMRKEKPFILWENVKITPCNQALSFQRERGKNYIQLQIALRHINMCNSSSYI